MRSLPSPSRGPANYQRSAPTSATAGLPLAGWLSILCEEDLTLSDNLSASLSSYTVGKDGSLTLLASVAGSDSGPNDMAVAREGTTGFLYTLASGGGTVDAYRINSNGSLTAVGSVPGMPVNDGAQGLAAF